MCKEAALGHFWHFIAAALTGGKHAVEPLSRHSNRGGYGVKQSGAGQGASTISVTHGLAASYSSRSSTRSSAPFSSTKWASSTRPFVAEKSTVASAHFPFARPFSSTASPGFALL